MENSYQKLENSKLLDLTGKTAIVTGGAMGIGRGIVERLAEAGANVVIADFDLESANKTVEELTAKRYSLYAVKADVSSEEDVQNMVKSTVEKFGSVDILVNNAGIYPSVPLSKMAKEDFEKVIAVNLRGVFLCVEEVSDQMITQGKSGKIINITSIDALHPSMIGLSAYDASKHGVWGFTKNVALELAEHKIWVNAVAPGGIATPGVAKMNQPKEGQAPAPQVNQEEMIKAFMAKIPMHRFGESDEIGKVVLFLASDMSSFMTGSQIVVDGGALLS
ncbi:SDR family oxidoreductase [Candidatus Berkelbacteria bacterium CG_4_10_14_0_8_um_filter_35_9_33_8]|uniref:SDR family oxidoreductase n=1 Tax=Candidatus Berkelbacteria bacterium CG_4_10_14_0_2_um_filter_35_9_33_12 TaxID=1974499 RepID=A0A2M7W438_9BACT|nr:MAG: SDR family oxidoreductase [Candidatus Berkelbacteria bacterium CG23_combo_of_CG06-09_8_20_14_all_33_15]PIZ28132.1 MAG: SDR family oxidoreductase [Candidatus Berkelbacteria bacterium CG_4_10_14_0_8_um_filter_35_9_33_8]PJA20425.1 MAG: SDR family oxidoreductase [Candidatus Berkelbacteria bacterium CG_4_10_14_0_2_um_filter_35_9_33_12]